MENMQIQNNLIDRITIGVEKFIFLEVLASIKTGATTAKRKVFIDGYFGTN
jgi:hypothetical protein